MGSVSDVLFRLADDYKQQGCHLQAAKCLQPICSLKDVLPTVRATACVLYAELLLDHFDNLDLAKQHLHQAERELRPTRGSYPLRCEVWDLLARCHRYAAAPELVVQAYASGLETCSEGANSKDSHALSRWRAYFLFRLADAHMAVGGPQAALGALARLDEVGDLPEVERALLALCRAVAFLHADEVDSADGQLAACAAVLETMMEVDGGDEASSGTMNAMRAHYFLLYTTVAMAMGHAGSLWDKAEGRFPLLQQLQETLKDASDEQSGYLALPPSAAAALGHLTHASLLRGAGKGGKSAVCLAQAEELIEQGLARDRVDWRAGESAMTAAARADARLYVRLKALAVEQRALSSLLVSDFAAAGQHAAELADALDRFPTMLACTVPSAHMVLGHYAQATGEDTAALAHFDAIVQQGPPHLRNTAALAAAVCEMQREGGDLSACAHRLASPGLADVAVLPAHERAAAQLVQGMLLHRQGDSVGARLLLSKALKLAHNTVGSTQLVGQVINELAPVQQQHDDLAGAEKMLTSATTLLKSLGDLPSLVTTLRAMCSVARASGDTDRVQKAEGYMQRKEEELRSRVAAAAAAPQHAAVLRWRV